jgi:glucosylceramidase
MHTESHCHMGLNRVVEGAALYEDFWDYATAGCDNFSYWNMVLPETRESGWGWKQNSLVVVDRATGAVEYTPDYHVMRLLGANIQPGVQRVPAHCLHLRRVIAFQNPDGRVVVLLHNTAKAKKAAFTRDGVNAAVMDIPGNALVAVNLIPLSF